MIGTGPSTGRDLAPAGGRALPLAVLVALLALLLVPVAPAAVAAPTVPDGDEPPALVLDVTSVGPYVLRPDGEIRVHATLRNEGPSPVERVDVRLLAWTPRLTTREAVREWAQGRAGSRVGNRFLGDVLVPRIEAGASVEVALTAPAAALGLSTSESSWGPRGLTVDVVDDEFAQLAIARAFTVWDPRPPAAPDPVDSAGGETDPGAAVSLLAPVTAGAPEVTTARVPVDRLAELTAEGGRLDRVLQAASARQVAWALDPTVLSSGTPPEDTEVPEPVGRWMAELQAGAADRDVLALPQADSDLVSAAAADVGGLYDLAARQGRETFSDLLESPTRAEVAWPAAGEASPDALALAEDAGATVVVLGSGTHDHDGEGPPAARSSVPAGDGRLDGLLVDTDLSTVLTAATEGQGTTLALSRLMAETAAVSRGASGDEPAHLLLTWPRDWDPDVAVTRQVLQTLGGAPWVRWATVDELLDTSPSETTALRDGEDVASGRSGSEQETETGAQETGDRLGRPEQPGGGQDVVRSRTANLDPEGLQVVAASLSTVRDVSRVMTRPDELLDEVEASAVAATSVAWRAEPRAWRRALEGLEDRTATLTTAVRVVAGSTVNVVSATADLPVTVANDLEQEVEVVVSVRSRNPRLVPQDDVTVRVPGSSTERVTLPVRAVANGNTEVVVSLRAPDGEQLGEEVTVPVRVRADWETRGILVAGLALAVVLVTGLVRAIRRGGRRGLADRQAT